jgi:hypothetical protein
METVKSGAFVIAERIVIQERSANKLSIEQRELIFIFRAQTKSKAHSN